jgi:hypothetical protein
MAVQTFVDEFELEFGDIGDCIPDKYLGANISQDANGVHLSSRAMIERLFDEFFPRTSSKSAVRVENARTPFPSDGHSLGGEVLLEDCPDLEAGEPRSQNPYRELLGALAYISQTTRPDIAFYTSQLARVQSNPANKHYGLAKHVLRYLMNTKDLGIRYRPDTKCGAGGSGFYWYTDSSWADVTPQYVQAPDGTKRTVADDDGRRSSFGYVGYFAGGPVAWASRIHKERRTLSTMEAELCAATETCKELLHLTYVANDLRVVVPKGIYVLEDNQSVLSLCLRTGVTKRSKHIECRWFFCRSLCGATKVKGNGVISMEYKCTGLQVADVYTKNLAVATFEPLRNRLVVTVDDQTEPPADLGVPTPTV